MKKLIAAFGAMLLLASCGHSIIRPTISVEPKEPLLASDLTGYFSKRAVVLPFREPLQERGLGAFSASLVFNELLAQGPFAMVSDATDRPWFGIDPKPSSDRATAAAIAAELGREVAVIGEVEHFVYSRNTYSRLIISMELLDSVSGELIHKQRIVVTGEVGYLPPLWDPSNYQPVDRQDLFLTAARTLVRRLHVRWWEGQTEDEFMRENQGFNEEEEEEEL